MHKDEDGRIIGGRARAHHNTLIVCAVGGFNRLGVCFGVFLGCTYVAKQDARVSDNGVD